MEDLVKFLVQNIVDNPKEVKVTPTQEDERTILKLSVDRDDMGKVIGKSGKIIKALRTLVKIKAIRENKRVYLELAE